MQEPGFIDLSASICYMLLPDGMNHCNIMSNALHGISPIQAPIIPWLLLVPACSILLNLYVRLKVPQLS
jgi:hypothetical protein